MITFLALRIANVISRRGGLVLRTLAKLIDGDHGDGRHLLRVGWPGGVGGT